MQVCQLQHGFYRFGLESNARLSHAVTTAHNELVDVGAALLVAPQRTDRLGNPVVVQLDPLQSFCSKYFRFFFVKPHRAGWGIIKIQSTMGRIESGHAVLRRATVRTCIARSIQHAVLGILRSQGVVPQTPGSFRIILNYFEPPGVLGLRSLGPSGRTFAENFAEHVEPRFVFVSVKRGFLPVSLPHSRRALEPTHTASKG